MNGTNNRAFAFICVAALFLGLSPTKASQSDRFDPTFSKDRFWDSNQAEILIFHATEMHYGLPRETELIHVLVKEDHDPKLNVKADDWKKSGLAPRLKSNQIITIPTGIYTYHQMISAFMERDDLKPVKTVFSSQEWCGQTFKELLLGSNPGTLEFNSYWDKEGKGKLEFPKSQNAIPYNVLPVYLRALQPSKKGELQIDLFPDLVSNKVGQPVIATASIEFKGEVSVTVMGKKKTAFLVEVEWGGAEKKKDRFWFSLEKLHPLIKWDRYDGSVYELRKRLEDDYWRHNRPGDEKLLR